VVDDEEERVEFHRAPRASTTPVPKDAAADVPRPPGRRRATPQVLGPGMAPLDGQGQTADASSDPASAR
jgi:hypothetical protein